jgi:putative membrane protein
LLLRNRRIARPVSPPTKHFGDFTMKRFALAAVVLLAASPVLAQSVGEKTGVNSAFGMAPSTADFVKQVAISDMFEIESSKLAQQRADASSKTFAEKMIKDHTGTSTELKGLATKAKLEVPTALDSSHQEKLDKLKGLQGADFDKEYDSNQQSAHKDAVDLFDRYAKGGDNKEIKAFASKHLPHLQQHLKMANDLPKSSQAKK